jgi:hypothetical protein
MELKFANIGIKYLEKIPAIGPKSSIVFGDHGCTSTTSKPSQVGTSHEAFCNELALK